MANPRASYTTKREKTLLINLINEKGNILNDKTTGCTIQAKKYTAWEEITNAFNSSGLGPTRTQKQLKRIWENNKRRSKKLQDEYQQEIFKTDGRAPPPPVVTGLTSKIVSIMRPTFDKDDNLVIKPTAIADTTSPTMHCEAQAPLRPSSGLPVEGELITIDDQDQNSYQSVDITVTTAERDSVDEESSTSRPSSSAARSTPTSGRKRRRLSKFTRKDCYGQALGYHGEQYTVAMKNFESQQTLIQLQIQTEELKIKHQELKIKNEEMKKKKLEAEIEAYQNWNIAASSLKESVRTVESTVCSALKNFESQQTLIQLQIQTEELKIKHQELKIKNEMSMKKLQAEFEAYQNLNVAASYLKEAISTVESNVCSALMKN